MSLSHVLVLDSSEWAASVEDMQNLMRYAPLHEPLQLVAEEVRKQAQHQFSTETSPSGAPWEPWHWTKDYPPVEHKTLQYSGVLMSSIVDVGGVGHIEDIGDRDLKLGTSINYAGIHDQGATFTLGIWLFGRTGGVKKPGSQITIPARPIVGWSVETLVKCDTIVADGLYSVVFGHPPGVRS